MISNNNSNFSSPPVLRYITCDIDDNDFLPSEWSNTYDHKIVPVITAFNSDGDNDGDNKNKEDDVNIASSSQITFT